MNKYFLLSTFLFISFSILAQSKKIQWSNVRELNSNKHPLSAVRVSYTDAAITSSDQTGRLRLEFQDKTPGQYVFLREITKGGYEVVNNKEIEQVKLSSSEQFGVDIIMAKVGVVEAAKKKYYNISDKALYAGFNQEKVKLRNELEAARLTSEQFEKQNEELFKNYERQKKELDGLAEKFAKINFDDGEPIYNQALELFKSGDIEEAVSVLEGNDFQKITNKILNEEVRIGNAQTELGNQKSGLEEVKRQHIKKINLLADMYIIQFKIDKAKTQFEQLVLLDESNYETLELAGDFYRENFFIKEAIQIYEKTLKIKDLDAYQIAKNQLKIALVYLNIKKHNEAKRYIITGLNTFLNSNSVDSNLLHNYFLIKSYSVLGYIYQSTGIIDSALFFYEKSINYTKKGLEINKDDRDFLNNLGQVNILIGDLNENIGNYISAAKHYKISNEINLKLQQSGSSLDEQQLIESKLTNCLALAKIHFTLGKIDSSIFFFKEGNKILANIPKEYINSLDLRHNQALLLISYGHVLQEIGHIDTLKNYYLEGLKILIKLHNEFPQSTDIQTSLAESYMGTGDMYIHGGHVDKAIFEYKNALYIVENLISKIDFDTRVFQKSSELYSRIGSAQLKKGKLDSVVTMINKSVHVLELIQLNSQPLIETQTQMAFSYGKICELYIHLREFDKALKFCKIQNKYSLELLNLNPTISTFLNLSAKSFSMLGDIYFYLEKRDSSFLYLKKSLDFATNLHKLDSTKVVHIHGLALANIKMGEFYRTDNNPSLADQFDQKGLKLLDSLSQAFPLVDSYSNDLTINYMRLGGYYSGQDTSKAIHYYKKSLDVFKRLYSFYNENIQYANGIAINLSKIGEIYAANNKKEAINYFLEAIKIEEKILIKSPMNIDLIRRLFHYYSTLGYIYLNSSQFPQSSYYFEKSSILLEGKNRIDPENLDLKYILADSYFMLGTLNKAREPNNRLKSCTFFLKAEKLYNELMKKNPQNKEYMDKFVVTSIETAFCN